MRITLSITIIALLTILNIQAQTAGVAQICLNQTLAGHEAQDCISGPLSWNIPTQNDLVLTRPPGSTNEWAADTIWVQFKNVTPPTQIRTCADPTITPPALHGGMNGVYVGDPCVNHVWIVAPTGTPVNLTCVAPTKNTDESPIDVTQLPLQFYFWEGLSPGPVYRQISPPQSTCAFTWPNMEVGTHYFTSAVVDAKGAMSSSSGEAMRSVLTPGQSVPTPPTITNTTPHSTIDARIYTIKQTKNKISFVQVATAPLSTPCDITQPVIDKYVVARESVTWLGSVKPQVVFGICQ